MVSFKNTIYNPQPANSGQGPKDMIPVEISRMKQSVMLQNILQSKSRIAGCLQENGNILSIFNKHLYIMFYKVRYFTTPHTWHTWSPFKCGPYFSTIEISKDLFSVIAGFLHNDLYKPFI